MLNVELDCQVRNTLFMDEEKTGKTSLPKLFFEIDKRLRIFFAVGALQENLVIN